MKLLTIIFITSISIANTALAERYYPFYKNNKYNNSTPIYNDKPYLAPRTTQAAKKYRKPPYFLSPNKFNRQYNPPANNYYPSNNQYNEHYGAAYSPQPNNYSRKYYPHHRNIQPRRDSGMNLNNFNFNNPQQSMSNLWDDGWSLPDISTPNLVDSPNDFGRNLRNLPNGFNQ